MGVVVGVVGLVDRPVRGQRNQRQQGDAEVAQGLEKAVQCGLVDDGPRMTVVPPSSAVRFMPSNRDAQRGPRCPWMRISYRWAGT